MKSKTDIKEFYDEFSGSNLLRDFEKLNIRHKAIKLLCTCYIPVDSQVLEIGCGVGIISRHLHKMAATILSVDISTVNIKVAQAYASSPKSEFRVLDITEEDTLLRGESQFDAILLADVIEHIPRTKHRRLLHNIERLLRPEGVLIITWPSPQYQVYLKNNSPEILQVIDETVTLRDILTTTLLNPIFFKEESIWFENQYLQLVLRKQRTDLPNLQRVNRSLWEKISFSVTNVWWRIKNKRFLKANS